MSFVLECGLEALASHLNPWLLHGCDCSASALPSNLAAPPVRSFLIQISTENDTVLGGNLYLKRSNGPIAEVTGGRKMERVCEIMQKSQMLTRSA